LTEAGAFYTVDKISGRRYISALFGRPAKRRIFILTLMASGTTNLLALAECGSNCALIS
jgi:hypothetical protein